MYLKGNGRVINTQEKILKEARIFYEKLFSSCDCNYLDDTNLEESLKLYQIKKLPLEQSRQL